MVEYLYSSSPEMWTPLLRTLGYVQICALTLTELHSVEPLNKDTLGPDQLILVWKVSLSCK